MTGSTEVSAVNLRVQVGTNNDVDEPNEPLIDSADIFNGTIFDGNNLGEVTVIGGNHPQYIRTSTLTSNGTVIADGPLATLTFNTIGVPR